MTAKCNSLRELIDALQAILEREGDLPIYALDPEWCTVIPIDTVTIQAQPEDYQYRALPRGVVIS